MRQRRSGKRREENSVMANVYERHQSNVTIKERIALRARRRCGIAL